MAQNTPSSMQNVKTIIADDHALIRAGLRDSLTNLPEIEIVGEVGNGPDLFRVLEEQPVDLLLMDVNMPQFEPVAAVYKIHAEYPRLKILAVSAYDDQAYVVGLLSAGVNGYHLKDQPLLDLQMAVRRIMDGGRWISDPLVNRLIDQHVADPDQATRLTRRQRELLYLLSQGYSNHKIASIMEISVKTVENHLTALYRAIGVESRLEANNYASHHPELLLVPGQADMQKRLDGYQVETLGVLLVDDNSRYRTQLGKLLRKTYPTLTVYDAEDSADAVRLAEQTNPKLAFIDVVLREEDGIQCARKIKTISPSTRMILISAYPDREFHRLALNAGAIAFLDKKDIDAATVRQVVEDALGR
jgi:DNA-binding NarL/FixJ family response regulator